MTSLIMLPTRRHALASATLLALLACGRDGGAPAQQGAAAGAAFPLPADVRATPATPARLGDIGRDAAPAEIQAWDISVNPRGHNLPPGRGSYAAGAALFSQKCAVCHGAKGEGMGPYPKLIGREPREGFPFGRDVKYVKTIGNYWPYATTLYDYIHRAMPLTAPGSLRPDEIYSVVAFLLAENEIVGKNDLIDASSLPKVRMPARDRFVVDDRKGGGEFR